LPEPTASPEPEGAFADRLARAITLGGPIPVAQFMAAANSHYYATRDPLGAAGDFTTAPEISQMFGEIIGLWLSDLWLRAGKPDTVHYVELGPGRGTLAQDALRSMAKTGLTPKVHFVETSPVLRAQQSQRLPDAVFHDDVSTLPDDGPVLIVANEFFDALPVQQIIRGPEHWHQRLVACQDTLFLPIKGKAVPNEIVPETLRDAPVGSIIETSPASVAIARAVAKRVVAQGGAALIIDYGYEGPAIGETLQAIKQHERTNPFDHPGEQDVTAHVDFTALAAIAALADAHVHGPVAQGHFLETLGIGTRAVSLIKSQPHRGAEIEAARTRLTHPNAMGALFKVMAFTGAGWGQPVGF
jgi:NADH dehydrogenase [ubiquinone] 1 alpha subcomplex assembly factor 7